MHTFTDPVDRGTAFTLEALKAANERTIDALQTRAATTPVKTLQMIPRQKATLAVGMFSLFEAIVRDGLSCSDGFREATDILKRDGEAVLKERVNELQLAINVLKHGRGRSDDALAAKAGALRIGVKLPGEAFFGEGDVSAASALIEVDDPFVRSCAGVIREVSVAIRGARPEFLSSVA